MDEIIASKALVSRGAYNLTVGEIVLIPILGCRFANTESSSTKRRC